MKKLVVFLFLLVPLFFGCDIYNNPIPYVKVDFTIYPNDVMYHQLINYGGYVYLTGGVNGIIVYRLDDWTFFAYDRACPHDFENPDSWLYVAPDGLRLVDSLCGSTYNILDGSVLSGPSLYPARKYNTRFDGVRLRIYS
ncbi:MAG: hypothetical protein MJZ57_00215 [Bacteroidales bacterium]|nr:hypothetical protein [Bacteroidales bacterium]